MRRNSFIRYISEFIRHISSQWISSGRMLTIFTLIILPTIVIVFNYLALQIESSLKNVYFIEPPQEIVFLRYGVSLFQYFVVAIILFVYPPYPFPITIEEYFMKRGYKNAVIEYEFVKKILYIAVPVFIILTVVLPSISPAIKTYTSIDLDEALQEPVVKLAQNYSILIVIAGIAKMLLAIARQKFRFLFAKGCLKNMSDKKDEVKNMTYLIKGLESYNSYLRRNLKLQVMDLKKIVFNIMVAPPEEKAKKIKEISDAFADEQDMSESLEQLYLPLEGDGVEKFTLKPLRKLYELLGSPPRDKFLMHQALLVRIKDEAALAATTIPLIISIIEVYYRLSS